MSAADSTGAGAIRYQQDLVKAIEAIKVSPFPAHLCIAGPRGCGQNLASKALHAWKSTLNEDCPLVRVFPAELAVSDPAVAWDRLAARLRAASAGVLHLQDIEVLIADPNAVPLLGALREYMSLGGPATVVLSGDKEAVAQIHALSPDLYLRFTHAQVRPFTPAQLADLTARSVRSRGYDVSADFTSSAAEIMRRVRPVGDLSNGRLSSALARQAVATVVARNGKQVGIKDLDVRGIRTIDAEPGAGFESLDRLIGLEDVKSTVRQWVANYDVILRREQLGLNVSGMGQHMVFRGPAGTAKTTVARIVGRILAEVGVLSSGHLIEAQRADLVGDGGDQVGRRVVEAVKRALGGVLFIDEAYALMDREGAAAGREAIDTLLKLMEDYRDEFVLIVAGYPVEMEQFLNANPGLRSRFVRFLDFPAYDVDELLQILLYLCAERGYTLDDSVHEAITADLNLALHYPGFGNGRHMRNLLESAIARQASRLSGESSDDEIRTLMAADFIEPEERPVSSLNL